MDRPQSKPPMTAERRYANHLRVGFNRLEFLLDFAQAYEGSGELVHAQMVAGPAHVKQFAALMQQCVSDYERQYGVIAVDDAVPADAADTPAPSAGT